MTSKLVVPHARDIVMSDYAAVARVLGFDLDNTLARSKMPMSDETARLFISLTHILPVAIVTGGRYELIESQVLDSVAPYAYAPHLVLLPTTGTSYYRFNGRSYVPWYVLELTADQKNRAQAALEKYARALGLWYKHTDGVRIEDRGSQITFSALGSQAHLDLKEAWDADGSKRTVLAAHVQRELPDLTVRVAGATSVDISSRGIDKAFAVSKIAQQFNISTSDIVFVGDRMSEGGNDYPAAVAGTHAVRVGGPDDTNDFMRSFMRAYTHGIMIDVVSRRVWVHDKEVAIADTEFSLLLALLHARGEVVSREDLLKQAWGYEDSGDTRLLSVSIARLRAVLEDNPQMPQRIQTVRGGGYRLVFA